MFHILVVEDDAKLRSLFCTVLTNNGYLALPAESGEKALSLLDSEYVDLIISDIMMSGMDGYELIDHLRTSGFTMPILIITAKERFEDVPNSKSLQAICELTDNFNRMVQELNSIESLRNDFVTTVSHEFKTPLAAIEGYATLLQDPSLSEADRNEYTRIIIDSTRQLTTMTGNILLLSRLEKQEIVTGRTMFSLDEQIRQAILLLEPLWEKKHLNLDIDLTACKFYGNCEMLQQVWINLLQNAIKFTPAGGMLSAKLVITGDKVRVSIRDTGVGMDDATMKRIFEKFYSRNSDPNEKGNGLGLSITKRIIDLMHGTIEVSSQVDEGSCFTVILPLEKA